MLSLVLIWHDTRELRVATLLHTFIVMFCVFLLKESLVRARRGTLWWKLELEGSGGGGLG